MDDGPPPEDRPRRSLRVLVVLGAAVGLAWFAWVERAQVADAVHLLAHVDPTWITCGSVASIGSIVVFAAVRSVLLGSGPAHLRLGRATTASFASGAIAATLPAGGAIATGYMLQRYREAGADAGLAGWTTIATGVVAPSVLVFMTLTGYAVAGERPSEAIVPGAVAVVLLVAFFLLTRNPRVLRRPAIRLAATWHRLTSALHRRRDPAGPGTDEAAAVDGFLASFGAVRAGPTRWAVAWALQLLSWIGEFVALLAAVAAVGGRLPGDLPGWGSLLAVYGTSQLAGALPIVPGGAGQVEAALVVGLTATGTDGPTALAASIAFRLMSHWLVVPIGWVCVALLRRKGVDVPTGRVTAPGR